MPWVCGLNDEFRGLLPKKSWYESNRDENAAEYSSNPEKAKIYEIGNLFVRPGNNTPEQIRVPVIFDVCNQTPVTVSRISDQGFRSSRLVSII